MTNVIIATMVGATFVLFFVMAAFDRSAVADALSEADQRKRQIAAERRDVGPGAFVLSDEIHNFHTGGNGL